MSFTTVDAPIPRVAAGEAAALLGEHWGLGGALSELGSQQDYNLRVDADGQRYVLKVSNPGLPRSALEAQHAAISQLRTRLPNLAIPTPVPTPHGDEIVSATLESGRFEVRLLEFVEGALLDGVRYLAPVTLHAIGRLLGEVTAALSDLDHPGADHRSQWDLRVTPELIAALAPRLDAPLGSTVTRADEGVADRLARRSGQLVQQICHADAHDGNIVVHRGQDGRVVPHGLIDFGDLVRTWRIADLAIATAAIVRRAPHDSLPIATALARGDLALRRRHLRDGLRLHGRARQPLHGRVDRPTAPDTQCAGDGARRSRRGDLAPGRASSARCDRHDTANRGQRRSAGPGNPASACGGPRLPASADGGPPIPASAHDAPEPRHGAPRAGCPGG